jgi:lysozyme
MTISQHGLDLIKHFEELRLKAYLCPAGIPTIGYGTTKNIKLGMTTTPAKAEALLKGDVAYFESQIARLVKAHLTQNQWDAVVSFTYNCGVGALQKSSLLKRLNADPADPAIAKEFLKWCKGGGKVLPFLLARRKREAEVYFTA